MKTTYPPQVYQIALTYLPDVGPVKGRKLASFYPKLSDIFRLAAFNQYAAAVLEEAYKSFLICEEDQVEILYFENADYPQRLKHLYDSPLVLFKNSCSDTKSTPFNNASAS